MATLVFSSIGTALGGPLGGAIGALAGRQIDGALFGPSRRDGPRLRELEVSLSTYGQAIPRIHGRMRVAGAIIWATELQEHSEVQGGGKGQPGAIVYTYAANLAIAISSRPIQTIGRIWADGRLLRGEAGDLKVGGVMRVHTGGEAQTVDPLIAAAEGAAHCPAFRGLAYVVFEALELAEFGNRIPALTFEVIADDAVSLHDIVAATSPITTLGEPLDALKGFAAEDTPAASLATLDTVFPMALNSTADEIVIRVGTDTAAPVLVGDPAQAMDDDAFGKIGGASRRHVPSGPQPSPVLRYLDVDRDYQPGTQHASGRAGEGQPDMVELPAALNAPAARALVERMRQRVAIRDRIAWRTTTLDRDIAPGACIRLPDRPGLWRVETWEWREAGIELELSRVAAPAPIGFPAAPIPSFPAPVDLPAAATRLVAFELPWDGSTPGDRPRPVAAVGAAGANWNGAALHVDRGDGQLWPLGSAGRTRCFVGTAIDILAPASALLVDRTSSVIVELAFAGDALRPATLAELANGANLALLGDEMIQFGKVAALGAGRWRLSHFLRGCAGTENAVAGHAPGDDFALIDSRLTALDPTVVGNALPVKIVALGRGDAEPVSTALRLPGFSLRPLAPVHARTTALPDGTLRLSWTRRARGGWRWVDGVDVPLAEEAERYIVTFDNAGQALRTWTVDTAELLLSVADQADLRALASDGILTVRQQGTHGVSPGLPLATVP